MYSFFFFFSSRRRHTRYWRDWSSDVCSSDLVRAVHGVDAVQEQIGHLVVEARLPQPGQPAGTDYLGEGYAMVRDPDTAVVEDALHRIVSEVRVELAEA